MSLTVVLALLVLVATLVLAIFTRTEGDRKATTLYTGSVEAGFLADSAVNLVIAQISDGTRTPPLPSSGEPGEPDPLRQTPRAWVSQPGLIRTFSSNRVPGTSYRLYSWNPLRVEGGYDPGEAANQVPSTWMDNPALYVDLNEPMPDLDAPEDRMRDRYPIFYPPEMTESAAGEQVEGFSISGGPAGDHPLPMPVQWVYVLGDGSVHHPEPLPGRAVRISEATDANPIVGRIAFWTDDETAKVNVNTAAGGEFWTPPWLETEYERSNPTASAVKGYGYSQPVRGEYQRYPGHPARTDLRAVFPELSREDVYKLTPRVAEGGSRDGTMLRAQSSIEASPEDADRLYAGLGEMRFVGHKPAAGARKPIESEISELVGETSLFERRKGFLSAYSRAPELTLSGTPRISIWPIHELSGDPQTASYRSPLDRLLAFCSSLPTETGVNPYHFIRRYPYSPVLDFNFPRNQRLYRYLQRMTEAAVPGVSVASFADKYTPRGRDQILTQMFDYIRTTNMSDMMQGGAYRYASANMVIPTRIDAGNGVTTGFGRTFTVRQAGLMFIANADGALDGEGKLHPSNHPREASVPEGVPEAIPRNRALIPGDGGRLSPNQRRIQALFVLELFVPGGGFKQMATQPGYRVRGLDTMTVGNELTAPVSLGLPAYDVGSPPAMVNHGSYQHSTGGAGGVVNYRWHLYEHGKQGRNVRATPPIPGDATSGTFNHVGVPVTITIDPANPVIEFSGGTIEVEIYRGVGSAGNYVDLMHTVRVEMAPVTLPAPRISPDAGHWAFHRYGPFGGADVDNPEPDSNNPAGRFQWIPDPNGHPFITQYDTVQTYILPHGDYRALFGPPSALQDFAPVPAGGNRPANAALRHFLSDRNRAVPGAFRGTTLTKDVSVAWTANTGDAWDSTFWAPAMALPSAYPTSLNAPWTFGDWDTGSPWDVTDGPLINKPDEGNTFGIVASTDTGAVVTNPFGNIYSLLPAQGVYGIDYHSPNRQLPSPVMFGSLPTGLLAGQPWQTLLFRPMQPPEEDDDGPKHPGLLDPPDHFLLDLFWMPVVEPYAISEPFSTAGKINMNWQVIPFTYIERSTGIHALLRNEKLVAIPETGWNAAGGYGKRWSVYEPPSDIYHDIDVAESLRPYTERFSAGNVFVSPSEVTELEIVPKGQTLEGMAAFWARHRLTGENIRERIYATLYPRMTTRSNVFTIHYRVQQLRKPKGGDPTLWEERDGPAGIELRGNTVIERTIDANRAAQMVDFATDETGENLEGYYRFRVLSNKRF